MSATWSNIKRKGQWVLPRNFRALAMMGQVDLDLTQVVLGEGISEIEAVAILGGVKIRIPHGMRVQVEGDATMGTFGIKDGIEGWAPPEAPGVRITGSAFLGSVEIEIVDPNESGWFGR